MYSQWESTTPMPSPFPGMNPYLESPEIWPEVHTRLIVAIADIVTAQIYPKYRVAIEKRVYQLGSEESPLVTIPKLMVASSSHLLSGQETTSHEVYTSNTAHPVPITVTVPVSEYVWEDYLEIREQKTGAIVTVIEVLSPNNKRAGKGRKTYENKRSSTLSSLTHLVEIDLLRWGQPMTIFGNDISSTYRILISRSNCRPRAELYPFALQERIPIVQLPLRPSDKEPIIDLQQLLEDVYFRAAFDLTIDYTREPVPPLSEEDTAWVNSLWQQYSVTSHY